MQGFAQFYSSPGIGAAGGKQARVTAKFNDAHLVPAVEPDPLPSSRRVILCNVRRLARHIGRAQCTAVGGCGARVGRGRGGTAARRPRVTAQLLDMGTLATAGDWQRRLQQCHHRRRPLAHRCGQRRPIPVV